MTASTDIPGSTSGPLAADDGFAATVAEELLDDDGAPSDANTLEALPTIGHVGRYALKHQLGAGGLGTVYAALDPLLSRPIAVKTLRINDIAADQREAFGAQLLAEARAAGGLNHPNIVTVFDAGMAEEGVYIAMERLRGRDLRQLMVDGWRPDAVQAARIGKRVADALAYAHGHGVVHCDIKPGNIFMIGRTQPKVLDFGIARVAQRGHAGMPVAASSGASAPSPDLGSPYYAAPEHLRGEALDARCDVYGLGVVLYEMLTARRAFEGSTLEEIRRAVLDGDVEPVHAVDDEIDIVLSGIVARAMARDPSERYRSARQLSRALREWISDETNGVGHVHETQRVRSRWVWAAGAAVGVGSLLALGLFAAPLLHPQSPEPAALVSVTPAPTSLVASAPSALVEPVAPTPAPTPVAVAPRPKPRDEAARARERERQRVAVAAPVPIAPAAPPPEGIVQLAVTPWGNVEVDGRPAGTTPPLTRLNLPAGAHQIVIRNEDFTPFSATITVNEDKPVTVRHRFGS